MTVSRPALRSSHMTATRSRPPRHVANPSEYARCGPRASAPAGPYATVTGHGSRRGADVGSTTRRGDRAFHYGAGCTCRPLGLAPVRSCGAPIRAALVAFVAARLLQSGSGPPSAGSRSAGASPTGRGTEQPDYVRNVNAQRHQRDEGDHIYRNRPDAVTVVPQRRSYRGGRSISPGHVAQGDLARAQSSRRRRPSLRAQPRARARWALRPRSCHARSRRGDRAGGDQCARAARSRSRALRGRPRRAEVRVIEREGVDPRRVDGRVTATIARRSAPRQRRLPLRRNLPPAPRGGDTRCARGTAAAVVTPAPVRRPHRLPCNPRCGSRAFPGACPSAALRLPRTCVFRIACRALSRRRERNEAPRARPSSRNVQRARTCRANAVRPPYGVDQRERFERRREPLPRVRRTAPPQREAAPQRQAPPAPAPAQRSSPHRNARPHPRRQHPRLTTAATAPGTERAQRPPQREGNARPRHSSVL